MRAYVIKNKDGLYMNETMDFVSNELWQSNIFNDYEQASCYCPQLCKVVEVEINEQVQLTQQELKLLKFIFRLADEAIELQREDRYDTSWTNVLFSLENKLGIYNMVKEIDKNE